MPNRCAVYGCGNVSDKNKGISVHAFPVNKTFRRQWVKFCSTTRADFREPKDENKTVVVCSAHFTPDCFIVNESTLMQVKIDSGYHIKARRLKDDAIPSINQKQLEMNRKRPLESGRKAVHKREIKRILTQAEMAKEKTLTTPITDIATDAAPEMPHASVAETQTVSPHNNVIRQKKISYYRSKGVQCCPVKHRSKGVQVGEPSTHQNCSNLLPTSVCTDVDDDFLDSEPPSPVPDNVQDDPDWFPETLVDNDDTEMDMSTEKPARKFAVYESALLALFTVCHLCFAPGASATITSVTGTMIIVRQECASCGESYQWKSQPETGSIPDGNLSLSAAICFAGALPRKLLRVLKFWGLAAISAETFFRHQKLYLNSAIRRVWGRQQDSLLVKMMEGDNIHLAGDARCDSMGHCAKYGSYSLHDTERNKIICMELVQSTEVKSSYHMELEGLKRSLEKVITFGREKNVTLVTDRHPQIQKWLREKQPGIKHFYDVWHIAKGLQKSLTKFSKGNGLVQKWLPSIINHLYWCARSSNGDGDMAEARWVSILNHLVDKHDHDSQLFPTCQHTSGLVRAWFQPGTEIYENLSDLLTKKCLIVSVRKMSSDGQTSNLEGYHSTLIHFAPKMFHFGYTAMKSRLQLAALHFNENAGRAQAITKAGKLQYSIRYPKYKKGGHVVTPIKQKCTYDYVTELQHDLYEIICHRIQATIEEIPRPLCHAVERPDKDVAVQQFRSRFIV